MSRESFPIVIPVNRGLDLANTPAGLPIGKLVRAQNKAPGHWGPRHGTTFIDRTSRGRGNPTFNGSTSTMKAYYNSTQMDLGRKFTVDVFYKVTDYTPGSQAVLSFGDATRGGIYIYANTDGWVYCVVEDDDANNNQLNSTTGHSDNDLVHVRVTRSDGTVDLYVDTVLVESDDSTLTATTNMKVLAENMLIGTVTGHTAAHNTMTGIVAGVYIRNFVDTDFSYAYSELPFPRGHDVLAAWTGELIESDALVRDASTYGNHAEVANITSGSRLQEVHEPVQAVSYSTVLDGRRRNMALVGGRLFAEVV